MMFGSGFIFVPHHTVLWCFYFFSTSYCLVVFWLLNNTIVLNLLDIIIFKLDIFLDILLNTLPVRLHKHIIYFKAIKNNIYIWLYDYMIVYKCKMKVPFQYPCTCTYRYIHTDIYIPFNRLWYRPCKRTGNISKNISKNISNLNPSNKTIVNISKIIQVKINDI